MRKRVLAIASGGGHWVQLYRLEHAFAGLDVVFASTYAEYAADVAPHRFHRVPDASRLKLRSLVPLVFRVAAILLRERPHVVITTGALPGLVALIMARIFLVPKTIWIDSIANCERLSMSGHLARPFADVYLTQWAHLATPAGPRHMGAVL